MSLIKDYERLEVREVGFYDYKTNWKAIPMTFERLQQIATDACDYEKDFDVLRALQSGELIYTQGQEVYRWRCH